VPRPSAAGAGSKRRPPLPLVKHFAPDALVTAADDALDSPHPPLRIGVTTTARLSVVAAGGIADERRRCAATATRSARRRRRGGLRRDGGGDEVDAKVLRHTAPLVGRGGICFTGRGGEHRRRPPPVVGAEAPQAEWWGDGGRGG